MKSQFGIFCGKALWDLSVCERLKDPYDMNTVML